MATFRVEVSHYAAAGRATTTVRDLFERITGVAAAEAIAVALHARDEDHLRSIAIALCDAGIGHTVIVEPDPVDQWMAIGVEPTTDRRAVRKVLSKLPLVR